MPRQSRKVQHIEQFLRTRASTHTNDFSDVHLLHNALSNHSFEEISLSTNVADIELTQPVIINAITGGDDKVLEINRGLSCCAQKLGIAMAVGSQYAAIKEKSVRSSYQVVRQVNPDGIIFANIGAYATIEDAKEAIEMLDAQALQIHLNIGQELLMKEGDRNFKGYLNNIMRIAQNISVPVLVKETGCGISFETAQQLVKAGIKGIDVSGRGGTNFLAIEAARSGQHIEKDFLEWGIPTVVSVIESRNAALGKANIIASGGINTPLECAKALSIGADAVGIAGAFLEVLLKEGEEALHKKIADFLESLKKILLLTGSKNIYELQAKPQIITGATREWLEARGFL